jgi:hypothetical protein
MSNYEVIISNVGKVYDGYSRAEAMKAYAIYQRQSEKRYTQDVTVMRDNEIYLEHQHEESFSD